MNSIYFALPRYALSGGNLVTLSLAKHLAKNGVKVFLCSGFQINSAEDVTLVRVKKGYLNSLLNVISFLLLSIQSVFIKNYVATHHLSSLFNFLKKSKFSFIQDVEVDFYPPRLKGIGRIFWLNYLKSKNLFFTSDCLANKVGCHSTSIGFPFVFSKEFSGKQSPKLYDAILVLRDGDYKDPNSTLRVFLHLKEKGYKVALINASRAAISGPNVFESLSRDKFLSLLSSSKFFICLSCWEGLGLPNLEAYCLGLSIISTPIPSAVILNKLDSQAVNIISNPDLDLISLLLEQGVTDCLSNDLVSNRMVLISKQNELWLDFVSNIILSKL